MPKSTVQPQWRSRRTAIGKKGALDYELLMDSEVDFTIPGKEPTNVMSSPTSVVHLEFSPVPEMKPLPGAWVTVGKKGRPLSLIGDRSAFRSKLNPSAAEFVPAFYPIEDSSNEAKHVDEILRLMHHLVSVNDSEQLMLAKQFADADPDDEAEEEETSPASKYVQALDRSTKQREKALVQAKDAKYWHKHRKAKQLKVLMRDMLIADLADAGLLDESEEIHKPQPLPQRSEKGSSRSAKARRMARFASAAARCYDVEEEDEMPPVQAECSEQLQVSKSQVSKPQVSKSAEELMEGLVPLKAPKRERTATPVVQIEALSADVELPSPKEEEQYKAAKHQPPVKKAKRHSKNCIIA